MMDDVECEMRNVECGVWIDEWCHPERPKVAKDLDQRY